MLLRNRLKELITTLDLTIQLENELINDGAVGNSLSDKIKSYQKYDEDEFIKVFQDEDDIFNNEEELRYQFRKYKRLLLDGRYNDLRWIAHERNQMMHFPGYIIKDFNKFQDSAEDAIHYFRNTSKKTTVLSRLMNILTIFFLLFILVAVLYLEWIFFGDYIQSFIRLLIYNFQSENLFGFIFMSVIAVFFIYLFFQSLKIIIYLIVFSFYLLLMIPYGLTLLFLKYWFFILLLLFSYLLWDKDVVDYINLFYINSLKIWEFL